MYNKEEEQWSFRPGRKDKNEALPLKDFKQLAESTIENKCLFEGWKTAWITLSARNTRATSNLIANMIVSRKSESQKP